ncbi:MAG TPA: hypothetical protein DHN33_02680, partial [Eubacteriaceae bacterium]|nr:hypothetical protein [Eubacteriaceae bacterium]
MGIPNTSRPYEEWAILFRKMWRSTMGKKLFLTFLIILSLLVFTMGFFAYQQTREMYYDVVESGLQQSVEALESHIDTRASFEESPPVSYIQTIEEATGYRITLVDQEGVVLVDTQEDPAVMDNHQNRSEIQKALSSGQESMAIRFSDTVGLDMMYLAKKVEFSDGGHGIIRTAIELHLMNHILSNHLMSLIVFLLISLMVAALITRILLGIILKPVHKINRFAEEIAQGNYNDRMLIHQKDEIGDLAKSLNDMADRLKNNFKTLNRKNIELETILKNVMDGIIVIDSQFRIKMISQSAFDLLQADGIDDYKNKNIVEVMRNHRVLDLLKSHFEEDGLQEQSMEVKIHEKIFRLTVRRIPQQRKGDRFLVIFQDITKIKALENMRRDFVANVSHELKTPITSIKGYIETLQENAIEDRETVKRFYQIIHMETER